MAGREGWKTASAERVDKPEQKRRREGDKHIHTEAETTEPRIEAAITTGNHAGSSGGSPRIRRTPTQPGIGSTSPDTVFARSLSALETEAVILPPPPPPRSAYTHLGCAGSLTHTGGTKSTSRRVGADIQGGTGRIRHRAMRLCVPAHTHTRAAIMDR